MDWEPLLLGTPFLVGTIVLLAVILFGLFGRWVITLENGIGTVFVGIGPIGRTRTFTYSRQSFITFKDSNLHLKENRDYSDPAIFGHSFGF